jgi:transcription initiation factor TFIIIB Brf1 subunit/transcription initiation factor TFIIB
LAAIDLACGQVQLGKPLIDILIELKVCGCTDLPCERDIWTARRKIVEQLPGVETALRSEDVMSNFCEKLNLKWSVRKVALYIHERIKPFVEGKSPNTVAGGCILLACQALEDESIDRTAVQETCLAAATTLQNFCKIGQRHWGVIVPTTSELQELSK